MVHTKTHHGMMGLRLFLHELYVNPIKYMGPGLSQNGMSYTQLAN